jgi:thioredoxin 1
MAKHQKNRRKKQRKRSRPGQPAARRRQPDERAERNPIQVRSRAQFERYLADELPVIVDFWAPWCGPCRMMAPIFEKVSQSFEGRVRFLKVNTEQLPELADAFGIRSIPSLLVLHGTEVTDSRIGLLPEPGLAAMARRADDRARGVTLGRKLLRAVGLGGETSLDDAGAAEDAASVTG